MISYSFTLPAWDILIIPDLKEHTADPCHLACQPPSLHSIPLITLFPFFPGLECGGPPLHVILLMWAIPPIQEIFLDQYSLASVIFVIPPGCMLSAGSFQLNNSQSKLSLTVFLLTASAEPARLTASTLTDFPISFLVRAS